MPIIPHGHNHSHDHEHGRHLLILKLIDQLDLPDSVKQEASAVFNGLAKRSGDSWN